MLTTSLRFRDTGAVCKHASASAPTRLLYDRYDGSERNRCASADSVCVVCGGAGGRAIRYKIVAGGSFVYS